MDLAEPIRTALIEASEITTLLMAYKNSYPVFTRRPIPEDAPPIVIIVSPTVSLTHDDDGIHDQRPLILRDISVYGPNEPAASYRKIEEIAHLVHDLFHRKRDAIIVDGWDVVQITVTGPIPAPVDDEEEVGRLVTLNVLLAALS